MNKKIAVISDVHANDQALIAVLKNIENQDVDAIWMLGDVTGRGCDPITVTSMLKRLHRKQPKEDRLFWLAGNHDKNILNEWYLATQKEGGVLVGHIGGKNGLVGTSDGSSENTILVDHWHYDIFMTEYNERDDLLTWLDTLPTYRIAPQDGPYQGIAVAHGAFRYTDDVMSDFETVMGYLLTSSSIQLQFNDLMKYRPDIRLTLGGHTHKAGIWHPDEKGRDAVQVPDDEPYLLNLDEQRYYINVGSVGFARDPDTCPTYFVLEWRDGALYAQKYNVAYTPDTRKCDSYNKYPKSYREEMTRCTNE